MSSRRNTPHAVVTTALLASALVAPLAGSLGAQVTGARADSARRDSAAMQPRRDVMTPMPRPDSTVLPAADQARGVDAEIRVALFDLLHDRDIPALSRLQTLQASPTSMVDSARAAGALRGREEMLFLLAQSYYRLGMDDPFRAAAQTLMGASGGRYAGVLRTQLLLDAFRNGDNARVKSLASQVGDGGQKGLAALVSGLASYQSGDYAAARTNFQSAAGAGAPYAPYAQYMDALTLLRADTTQTAAALTALEQAAGGATGEFADQVRLTAAQLAYEGARYDDAIRFAGQVNAQGGLAAQALLTRAWALYKKDDVAAAGEAFGQFASRFPQLPERDEARLMQAQAMLQQGQTAEAGRVFRQVADSMAAETSAMQGRTSGTMQGVARALVQARAAGLLFLSDPAVGKSVALNDAAGAEATVLAAVVSDTMRAVPQVAAPDVITLDDLSQRLTALGTTVDQGLPRRVLFTPVSATNTRIEYASRASSLYDADVSVALARYRLNEQLDARARQIQMMRQLQASVAAEARAFDAMASQLNAVRDSLGRLTTALDARAVSVRQMFQAQINTTRMLATENAAALDSVRNGLSGGISENDRTLLEAEARTAALYVETANLIEQGLEGAVRRHPAFALRDSVRNRGERLGVLLAQVRSTVDATQGILAAEIARLEGSESDRIRGMRSALAAAESKRTGAESQLVATVDRELTARAGELLAGLRRDKEAAEFGTASASFFQALDAGQRANAASSGTASGTTTSTPPGAPVIATSTPPRNQ